MQLFVSVAPSYVMTIQVRMTKLWQAHVNLRQWREFLFIG